MINKFIKTIVFILILVFYSSFILHQIKLPFGDDLPRMITDGRQIALDSAVLKTNFYSYTEPSFPLVNHHWFSGVVFYGLYQMAGFSGLTLFATAVLLLMFSLLFWIALKRSNFWLVALLSIPTILILWVRTNVRPEIFSYLFIVLYFYLLFDLEEYPERKRIFWLIPLQLLWINMHVFFGIGLMLIAGFLVEQLFVKRASFRHDLLIKKLTVILVMLVAVCFINPNGIKGMLAPYHQWQDWSGFPINTPENLSILDFFRTLPLEDNLSIVFFFLAVPLLALGLILNYRRKPIFFTLAGIGSAVLGFYIMRSMALFGLVFLPAASIMLNVVFIRIKKYLSVQRPQTRRVAKNTGVIILVTALLGLTIMASRGMISKYRQPGIGLTPRSNDPATFFKEHHLSGPLFNDPDIGSYLIYHLYPREKVFIDNRFADAYSAKFFSTYLEMLKQEDKWQTMLDTYRFNAIFFNHNDQIPNSRSFLYRRMHDPVWSLVYADTNAVILLKSVPENQNIIKTFKITKENIVEKLSFLVNSPDADDQIAAADLFNLMGRADLALATFQKVTGKWPDKGKIWMVMGKMEILNKDGDVIAAGYDLERAIDAGWNTAEAYSFLGLAYTKTGEYEKAEKALRKALKINPDQQDARELLTKMELSP